MLHKHLPQPALDYLFTFLIRAYKSVTLNTLSKKEYNSGNANGIKLADFGKDLLKAALLAILAVSLLTGATFILSKQITPPPGPSIDVFTDRDGKGTNVPSQSYRLNETISMYAQAGNGTGPAVNQLIAFSAYGPGNFTFIASKPTNASGIAKDVFKIPDVPEISVGLWKIIAATKINDILVLDALTFECTI